MKKWFKYSCLVWMVLPCYGWAYWLEQEREIMGTVTGVKLSAENQTQGEVAAEAVFDVFKRFDHTYSTYNDRSELSELNRKAAQQAVEVTPELMTLLHKSLYFSGLTDGLFDITYASVGSLYDYRKGIKPDQASLDQAIALISYKNLLLNQQNMTVQFSQPGMKIDLGGIAKGFAIDQAAEAIQALGITQAVIYAGGDSRYLGGHGTRPWVMGIRHPRDKNALALRVPLENTAVSTSGDYERFFIDNDGERAHHIINPGTGKSPHHVVSATVIAPEAVMSDGLSTSLMLMNIQKGLALVERLGFDAILIDRHGKLYYSAGLMDATAMK